MSRAVITYAKREMKKLIPVLVLGVGYILFLFFKVYLDVRNFRLDGLLSFAYPGSFEITKYIGDVFLSYMAERMNSLHSVAVLVLEIFLIFRLFYQENRSEISDFLRILPIREWQKIWIKAGAGEILILCISVLFGAIGTCFNLVIDSGVQEINSMIRYRSEGESVNSFAGIWLTALLLFLSMSAIFLVLFAAQCCIHSMLIGFLTGFGILFTPMYFSSALLGNRNWSIGALLSPYPEGAIGWTMDYAYSEQGLFEVHAIWEYLPEKVGFLLIAILAALIVLVAASRFYWHIRESANSIINSKAVMEFILTGLALAVAVGIVVFIDTIPNDTFGFYAVSLLIGGGLLGIFNIIAHLIEKRQKGV